MILGIAHSTSAQPLPEGNTGIAARHPGDVGIGSDPAVIFADDFESYSSAAGLASRWNNLYQTQDIRIATESGNVFSGNKALEFTVPQQSAELSNAAVRLVDPALDVLFLRYYAKFDTGFNVLGSSHNGAVISANYCCPGVPADGTNKFLASYEAWRDDTATANPGRLNVYVYYPDQRDIYGDHLFPTGIVLPNSSVPGNFGSTFVARPDVVPQLGRWYSYELMVKANTPGQRDGRIAMWLDGKLIADFPNLRLRDVNTLKINQFEINLHVRGNNLALARKWYDNVVAATSYIGPMAGDAQLPGSPTNLRLVP
ncbi:MAG: hypothetical protein DMF90_13035 [Acidobacteria bacterium]|nr:MAG: hypothetical protein DMF90_13035 [Acidobacteriota bacterium]